MKTIQISDETYDFLVNLAQEMKTQNNRWTQNVGFIIRSKSRDYIECSSLLRRVMNW